MTRKRFVKLLMRLGASRNKAQEIAAQLPPGSSYREWYLIKAPEYLWWAVSTTMSRLAGSFISMGEDAAASALPTQYFSDVMTVPGPSWHQASTELLKRWKSRGQLR